MKLKTLHLENFRNYQDEIISFSNGINLLCGDNAQGKTNVVEAIFLLATGKSHRTKNIAELIQQGESQFRMTATFEHDDYETVLQLLYSKKNGKTLYVNDILKKQWSELFGMLHAILFSPESMDIVKGGPFERRRFLDILLCQIDPLYLRSLQQYTAILRMKLSALRNKQSTAQYLDMFPIWNEGLARFGGIIAHKRAQAIHILEIDANKEMATLSQNREELSFNMNSFYGKEELPQQKMFQEVLFQKMEHVQQREIESGRTLVGVHKDELHIAINGQSARLYASQGQQRSIALALIMASMKLYETWSGHLPILLLDDVMSELDPHRQEYLLKLLVNTQTVMTTTDVSHIHFDKIAITEKSITHFTVKNAHVKRNG